MKYIKIESGNFLTLDIPGIGTRRLQIVEDSIVYGVPMHFYTFINPDANCIVKTPYLPVVAFGMERDDALRMIFSNDIKPVSTYKKGLVGFRTMADVEKFLQVIDDAAVRRTAGQSGTEMMSISGHIQLEFE